MQSYSTMNCNGPMHKVHIEHITKLTKIPNQLDKLFLVFCNNTQRCVYRDN